MKKIAILSVSALLLVGLAAFQPPKKVKKATKAKSETPAAEKVTLSDKAYDVKFDRTFHDFGKATEGDQVETVFNLTNVGKEPVLIQRIDVQCGCTTPSYSKEPIMPGATSKITVGFNTRGKVGSNSKTVTVVTNGGSHELKFTCEVAAKTVVDPITPGNQVEIKPNK